MKLWFFLTCLRVLKGIFIRCPLLNICWQFKEKQNLELPLSDSLLHLKWWLFIYTNCFPTVPSNAEWHFQHICTFIRQTNFSSPSWEIRNISWYMWALAYTTAGFPLSFWQIGKFRWESSSTFLCPQHLNNPAQTEECSIYAQLFTGGQNPSKTPQMWIFCRKQPRVWAPEVPQLSKGGGKQGQPSVLHASPDALKSWQTVDSLFLKQY